MNRPSPNPACDPQQNACLLRRLAEDSQPVPEHSRCPVCQQTIEQLDAFAREIGQRLADRQATRQEIARKALEQVGIDSSETVADSPDGEITHYAGDEPTVYDDGDQTAE